MTKYILLETFVDRSGNLYSARSTPYEEGELPESVTKNPLKVRKIEDNQVAVFTSKSTETTIINLNSEAPNLLVPKFLEPNPVIIDKVDINSASIEEIKSIKGIGDKTASLLFANRPYTDNLDLSRKVKPPLGKTWADFNFMFGKSKVDSVPTTATL